MSTRSLPHQRRPVWPPARRADVRGGTPHVSGWTICVGLLVSLLLGLAPLRALAGEPAPHDSRAEAESIADSAASAGARLYRHGLRADGSPLTARRSTVQGVMVGAAAACEACHRRSAMGMQEGRWLVPPIAGPVLFEPGQPQRVQRPGRAPTPGHEPLRHQARPAYTLADLARALREGVDPSGRALGDLMPRYSVSDADVAQLAAHLRTLDPRRATGLDAGPDSRQLRLATVLTPDAPASRRAVVTETLQRWAAGARVRGRTVQLQVWQLAGPPDTWARQLEAYQAAAPVYALLSGAGRAEWTPVQAFCEAHALPCLLPLLDRIPAAASGGDTWPVTAPETLTVTPPYYSLYFSAAVEAEALLAARHLQSQAPERATGPAPLIVQCVDRSDAASLAAASRFDQARADTPGAAAVDVDACLAGTQPRTVLAWLAADQVQALLRRGPPPPGLQRLLLSAQLAPPAVLDVPLAWQPHLAWLSMHSDPTRLRAAHAMVVAQWLRGLGLPVRAGTEQAEVYAATFFLGDALARMRQGWSPAWLMEQLETAVNNRPAGAAYFSLSLGPGQRIAAKTGAVLVIAPAAPVAPAAAGTDGAAPMPWFERVQPAGELIRAEE